MKAVGSMSGLPESGDCWAIAHAATSNHITAESSDRRGHNKYEDYGHYGCTCCHPLFVFNQFGDLERCAYNLGNFLRTLATPEPIKIWSLTTLREKLIKIGAKVVRHGRFVAFQMAGVAITRNLFADILRMIAELRSPPVASTT